MTKTESDAVIAAFTVNQVARLTGVSVRQLRYWDRDEFFAPSLSDDSQSRPLGRLYSFRDVVSLKVLHVLRNQGGCKLSHLREIKSELALLSEKTWSETTLHVLDKRVVFDTAETRGSEEGRGVLQISLSIACAEMRDAVKTLFRRDAAKIGKIEKPRGRSHGRAVIAGTRIAVKTLQEFAKAGYSIDQIRAEYPTLTEMDISAAIEHDEAA